MCLTPLYWLSLFGAFLLGLLVGWWIWSKYQKLVTAAERERNVLRAKLTGLEGEHQSCLSEITSWKTKYEQLSSEHAKCQGDSNEWKSKYDALFAEKGNLTDTGPEWKAKYDALFTEKGNLTDTGPEWQAKFKNASTERDDWKAKYMALMAANVDPDDLKKVEGIGPKIEEILNQHGVKTWAQLADTESSQIKAWLDEAGPRFKMHNPGSWPKQARMAAEGRWEALQKWQDEHDHGLE